MRTLILMTLAASLPGAYAAALEPWGDKPRVQPLLVEEGYRPPGSPARGETAWDLVELAAHRTRKARRIYEDAKDWAKDGTAKERPGEEWVEAERRLANAESAYLDVIVPALMSLEKSFTNGRALGADVDLALMEREYWTRLGLPDGPSAAMNLNPNRENIQGLRLVREWGEGSSLHAEELLEKARAKLEWKAEKNDYSDGNYLFDMIVEAEDALKRASARALEVAQGQAALLGKDGPYAKAIDATAAYGGLEGKGPFKEEDRALAVRLSNEAKKLLVANEYRMASRVEEVRTLSYLLSRFGRL